MGLLTRHRLLDVAVDAVLIAAAWYLAFFFRFNDLVAPWADLRNQGVWLAVPVKVGTLIALGVYARWWRYTSLRDVVVLARAIVIAEAVVYAVFFIWPTPGITRGALTPVPRGIVALDLILTGLFLLTARALTRMAFERAAPFAIGREVLVIGAGNAGELIVREMAKPRSGYTPIGILDDDPSKQTMRLHNVKVIGTLASLERALAVNRPDEIVIAMPSAEGRVRGDVVRTARRHGVSVRTLPGPEELLAGSIGLAQLRDVRVEDLLGRPPVRLDLSSIGDYLNGRSVIVTGAGGSIGAELARQIARLGPARLVLIDNGETSLFEIGRELAARGVAGVHQVLGDVKDIRRMRSVFHEHRPQVVFHAAAYKHVPMMELNPLEAVRNNTLATRDLASLAAEFGVARFVLISTDKAVNPQTVMGASKALCEWVVEAAAQAGTETRFIAVRFGNVLASSGSVIPIFRSQIEAGGPVTVTDERMTRFFMTIPEAAQLVVEAGGAGESGDIFVLDMGEPVRIMDLAHQMIRLSGKEPGRDIEVRITGIRPGEKLSEALFSDDEQVEATRHEKLLRARRAPIDGRWLSERLAALEPLVAAGDADGLVRAVDTTVRAPVRADADYDRSPATGV
jgi:FlaA1/EpsC-like NDP-sugar epimerase